MPLLTVCLMIKAPKVGEVKTRLGSEIGFDESAEIYRRLVENQMHHLSDRQRVEIHFTPTGEEAFMRTWLGSAPHYFKQADGNLGNRLRHAMEGAFARGAEAVAFLGGDCPDVTRGVIDQAESELANHDVAIGPTEDGGYYLLGVNSHQPRLFEEIDWSTNLVFFQTLDRIRELGLRPARLPVLADVDDLASLQKARHRHAFLK